MAAAGGRPAELRTESGAAHCDVMGSFTELTLAFTFAQDKPLEVIGAFAEWRVAEPEWVSGASVPGLPSPQVAPELPTLETAFGEQPFDADTHLADFSMTCAAGDDPMEGLSILERAAVWRWLMGWPDTAYFPGTPSTALRWDPFGRRWTLTTRTLPKDSPDWVQMIVAPLGSWAVEGRQDRAWFAGYILDEYSPRPVLIWSVGHRRFQFEGEFEQF